MAELNLQKNRHDFHLIQKIEKQELQQRYEMKGVLDEEISRQKQELVRLRVNIDKSLSVIGAQELQMGNLDQELT